MYTLEERKLKEGRKTRYIPKIMKLGGRSNYSHGVLIPKALVEKYQLDQEDYIILEEDEKNGVLVLKKINWSRETGDRYYRPNT